MPPRRRDAACVQGKRELEAGGAERRVASRRLVDALRRRQLDELEQQIDVSNQNLKAAEAQFAAARAAVRGTRAQPVSAGQRERRDYGAIKASGTRAITTSTTSTRDYPLPGDVSYEIGRVGAYSQRRDRASRTNAQATAADLEAARLSLHAELALDYLALRGVDRDKQLLDSAGDLVRARARR